MIDSEKRRGNISSLLYQEDDILIYKYLSHILPIVIICKVSGSSINIFYLIVLEVFPWRHSSIPVSAAKHCSVSVRHRGRADTGDRLRGSGPVKPVQKTGEQRQHRTYRTLQSSQSFLANFIKYIYLISGTRETWHFMSNFDSESRLISNYN